MARAKRHYLPGQIWHITHRCHKRELLLKFAKDRHRWLQWLYQAKRRYGLSILNYMVTSNHIHLLVVDDGDREVIPRSMQLVAGRSGQEFNQRKDRKGAFWEDRYHATAVEKGDHLLHCLVYIDLNMVRAGVVDHPSQWSFCGYNEIQNPRRKNALIAYDKLKELVGVESYEQLKRDHKGWLQEHWKEGQNAREDKWTRSIAVGSKSFVEYVKAALGIRAKGRKLTEAGKGFQLREAPERYERHLGVKNEDIGTGNLYLWEINPE